MGRSELYMTRRGESVLLYGYFSLLISYESEEFATSLPWPRHADWVNKTGMRTSIFKICRGCHIVMSHWFEILALVLTAYDSLCLYFVIDVDVSQ